MSKTTERKDFESIPTINKLFFQIDKECATRYVKKWFQIFIKWQDIWKGFCDPTIVCFGKRSLNSVMIWALFNSTFFLHFARLRFSKRKRLRKDLKAYLRFWIKHSGIKFSQNKPNNVTFYYMLCSKYKCSILYLIRKCVMVEIYV